MISAHGITHIGGSCNKENQDTFFIGENMVGIFDGHGLRGGQMAIAARDVFARSNIYSDIASVFAAAEEAIKSVAVSLTKIGGGGTTASVLYVDPDGSCRVAHVGDSEARYFDDVGVGSCLNADHSPTNMSEFLRIMDTLMPPDFEYAAIPGRGPSKPIYTEEEDGSWTINPIGGFYRNVRKDWASYLVGYRIERLAVTRALGDFTMKKHGVIAEPSIVFAPPPAAGTTRAIVVASDGLWDCLQYAEVCVIVRRPDLIGNAEAATTELVAAALAAGERIYGSTCDNITAIVVYVTKT